MARRASKTLPPSSNELLPKAMSPPSCGCPASRSSDIRNSVARPARRRPKPVERVLLQGAPRALSWGGGIGPEAAVGDATQDRDGRGQGPALVVGEMFDVG